MNIENRKKEYLSNKNSLNLCKIQGKAVVSVIINFLALSLAGIPQVDFPIKDRTIEHSIMKDTIA